MWKTIRKNYRRLIASLLTMAMVVTNAGGNLGTIFAAGETENALFLVEGEELKEAIREAREQGEVFDFSELHLAAKRKSIKTRYEKLLGKKEGAVYALNLEIDDSYAPEGTELQVFYNAGTEDVIFLFLNGSDMVVDYRVNIDGYETEPVRVNPNTASIEADGGEAPSYAENYEAADMIDDEAKKLGAEVLNPEETTGAAEEETGAAGEEGKDNTSTEETGDAATEESSEAVDASEESKENNDSAETEGTEASEEAEGSDEAEAGTPEDEGETGAESESVEEKENDTETETEAETEASEEAGDEDGELLSISRHEAAIVAVSVEELEDREAGIAEETEASEEETEEEAEAETEAETEKESEAETEKETEAETESESKADETEADAEEKEEESGAETGNVPEEGAAGTETEKKPEESEAGTEAESKPGESETGAEDGKDIIIEETGKDDSAEIPEEDSTAADIPDSDGSGKGDQIEMDGQLLEGDDIEILGELKGKEYDTVTILDHVNARAWKIALEDIEAIIVSEAMDYVVDYGVNFPEAATVKGANSVSEGENLYFAVEPEEGFEIVGVYANGSEVEEIEDISELASASNWKGYSHVYVVEGVEEDLWVEVEAEELVIAAETYTAETGDAVFSVDVPDGAFKEKVKLRVTKIEGEAELKELVKQANDALKDGQAIAEAEAYDIAFIALESGEEIEPLKPVAVDMSFKEAIASDKNEAAEAAKEIVVVHLPDDAEAKTVASAENADTTEFSFQADSFSLYMRALVMKPRVTVGETGYPTIARAVVMAKDGDTITLLDDFTESVTISKNVTFDLNKHTWMGADNKTALTISKGNVEVENGTMSSAVEKCKAIEAKAGILTLRDVKFTGPVTALYLNASSLGNLTAELTGCTFNENIRAIYAGKTKLTLNECEIIKNNSLTWSNGAIVYLSNSETTVSKGEISDNIGVERAIIEVSSGSFVMDGTTLTNNSGSGVVYGGADITLRNVVATGNIGTSSMNSGGSVLNANNIKGKKVILENVVATNNENTKEHGGAFYFGGSTNDSNTSIEIKGCTITDNTAYKRGGAIYLKNKGTTIIHDTVITRNTANDKVTKAMGYGQIGGGLYVESTEGRVTLSGSTRIYNNYTPNDKLIPGTNTHGSADVVLSSTKVTSSGSAKDPNNFTHAHLELKIQNPFTDEDGNQHTLTRFDRTKINKNGYYWLSGSNYYWPMGYYTSTEEPARVYLNGAHTGEKDIKADNLAEAVKAAQDNDIDKIYVCGNTTVDMASAVSLNSGVTFVRCMDHPTGHMFTINGDVILNNAHIDGQNVAGDQSLIYVPSSGHLTIAGDTVIENGKNAATKGKGGAIYVLQGSLTMSGGEIRNNTACEGGGIYAMGGGSKAIVFEGGTVSKNTATGGNGGGGAYIEATSSEFGVQGGRTLFDSNVSAQLGGGVFLVNGTNANTHHYIYKATFTNNQSNRFMAYFDGGAIYIQSGTTAHMKNVYVSGNRDSDKAGNGYTAVAVCPSGEVAIYELEGLLSINNGKNPDIGVIKAGTINPTAADPKVYLPSNAPGGGEVRYTDSKGNILDTSNYQFIEGYFRLYTEAAESVIDAAYETAEKDGVIITDNYASQFGSGIMTNGILKIGTETKSLKVVKEWADDKNHDNDQILVYLTKDGKIVDKDFRSDSSVILNKGNNWSYTWTNLGNEFEWGVKEASVHGYNSTVKIEKDTQFSAIADKYYIATITNEPSGELSDKLVITKTAHGLDPDASYKFTLKLDNVGDKMFALQMDGTLYPIYNNEIEFYLKSGQSAVVDGLPEGFTYEVEEEEGDYYTYKSDIVTANETGNIFEVSRVNVSKIEISGSKEWDDDGNRDGVRPESIHVTLTASNGLTYDQVVKADASNNWSWKFTDLPEWDGNGDRVIYTVSEEEVKDYSTVYPKADSTLGKYDIKNVHTPGRTSRTVEKIWKDGENRDHVRPETVTVQLYETIDGDKRASGDAVTLSEENGWSYTWNDLFVNDNGKPITYSVEEVNVPEKYVAEVQETGTKFIITNTYQPLTVSKTVEKRWDDNENKDNLRPVSIQARLLADGQEVAVVILNETNGWKYTWTDLPVNRNGNQISYTVEEIEIPDGYSAVITYEGDLMVITNTHTPNTPGRPDRPGGGGNPGGGNPGGGNPPGGPGTTTIEEPGVPLANLPPESMTELIEDSEVPLAALPRTGDSRHTKALMMMFGIAGLGMLLTAAGFRKRKDESDD